MKIAIVGGGRAAAAMQVAIEASELSLCWTWCRRESVLDLGAMPHADTVLIAVSDDAILEVVTRLAHRECSASEVWLHLSGSLPGSLCRATAQRPKSAGCLHPLQALTGGPGATQLLKGAMAGIDGEALACSVAEDIARSLGMNSRRIDSQHKALYHAAAVTAAGQTVALLAQAITMLEHAGFSPSEARAALLPLVGGAVGHLRSAPPDAAITGPIARGDVGVIHAHLQALTQHTPALVDTYKSLARTGVNLKREQLAPKAVAELDNLLE